MKENKNPYVILSAAMTIDGKITSKTGDPELSDDQDWREVHKLRSQVDAIMVGKGTILKDDPKLHIKFHEHKGYHRIVVDSNLSIPIDSQVVTYEPDVYSSIICTTENTSEEKITDYESRNMKIIKAGTGKYVDIEKLLPLLYDIGIKSILLEGGGTLNWSFFEKDLIDEMRLTIAPWIVGGQNATSLVEGEGFKKMIQGPRYELMNVNQREDYVVLKYKRRVA